MAGSNPIRLSERTHSICRLNERIVDGDDLYVTMLDTVRSKVD